MLKYERVSTVGFKTLATLKARDLVQIGIGILLGAILVLPSQRSVSDRQLNPSALQKSSLPPSSKPVNAYNARIITKCPVSPDYATGTTQLICNTKCEKSFTRWGPPRLNAKRIRKVLRMQTHTASRIIAKYPLSIDFLDIGANVGFITSIVLSQEKGHRILAVEPVEKNVNYICRTAQINYWLGSPYLTLVHAAASDHVGKQKIYVPIDREDNAAINTVAATMNVKKPKREEDIFLLDGDGLLKETGFKPKFIKIDTQGHEFYVLRGLKQYLKEAGKGELIVMAELHYGLTRASGVDVMDIYKLMVEELGYSPTCIPDFKINDKGIVLQFKGEVLTKAMISQEFNCADVFYVKL